MATISVKEKDDEQELRGRPRLDDAVLDDIDAEIDSTGGKGFSVDFTKLELGQSPFDRPVDTAPRKRPGWQQTLKRDDEIQNGDLRRMGYEFIRKQLSGKGEDGKPIPRQPVGKEKGERYKQFDHHDAAGRACYVYWMEVPEELVNADIRAMSFKSHSRLKDTKTLAKTWEQGLNSRIGRKDQIVSVESQGIEDFTKSEIHPVDNDTGK